MTMIDDAKNKNQKPLLILRYLLINKVTLLGERPLLYYQKTLTLIEIIRLLFFQMPLVNRNLKILHVTRWRIFIDQTVHYVEIKSTKKNCKIFFFESSWKKHDKKFKIDYFLNTQDGGLGAKRKKDFGLLEKQNRIR